MSALVAFLFFCLRYLRDFFLVFSGAMGLLLFYLWYSQNVVQETALLAPLVRPNPKGTQPLLSVDIDESVMFKGNTTGVSDISAEESGLQASFFMVSATNIPIHSSGDIRLVSNFNRLKVQSMKTIEALAQNRRRMAQRSAAQVRKLRVKRARAALDSRQCLKHL